MTRLLAGLVAIAFLAGCAGSDAGAGGGDTSPTPPPPPPPPKTVASGEQASGDVATSPNPYAVDFLIDEGYNHLFITFHVSGAGSYRLVVWGPGDEVIHDTGDQTSMTQPDSHSHENTGAGFEVVPGNYRLEVSFTGVITYHLNLTESADDSAGPDHEH